MNKLNIQQFDKFPITRETITFMQDMIYLAARLTALGGSNYILSGCAENGNSVSSGYVVIDGEILPFEGGNKVATVAIVEKKTSVIANGNTYADMRIARTAKFATGIGNGYYTWADFKRSETLIDLAESRAKKTYVDEQIAALANKYVPTGAIIMWSGAIENIPTGWALCDGQVAATGIHTPDLRGRFIVGYNSYGSDYSKIGNTGGEEKHTLIENELAAHSHNVKDYFYLENNETTSAAYDGRDTINQSWGPNGRKNDAVALWYKNHNTDKNVGGAAHENRPPYYVLAFIIKL